MRYLDRLCAWWLRRRGYQVKVYDTATEWAMSKDPLTHLYRLGQTEMDKRCAEAFGRYKP